MTQTIKVPSVPSPTDKICFKPAPLLVSMERCDRRKGHTGLHSWEWTLVLKALEDMVKIVKRRKK